MTGIDGTGCSPTGGFVTVRRVGRVGATVLEEATYRTPGGAVKSMAVVGRPDAVAVLPVRVSPTGVSEVLLVCQPRPVVGEPALVEVVAGKVDHGEQPPDTARRELREETGLIADRLYSLASGLCVSPGYSTERMYLFAATVTDTVVPQRGQDAAIAPTWMPLAEALSTADLKTLAVLLLARNRAWLWGGAEA